MRERRRERLILSGFLKLAKLCCPMTENIYLTFIVIQTFAHLLCPTSRVFFNAQMEVFMSETNVQNISVLSLLEMSYIQDLRSGCKYTSFGL